jgi:hypothetical protein
VFLFGSEILIFGVIFGVDFSPCEAFSSCAEGLICAFCFCFLVSSARPVFGFHEAGARFSFILELRRHRPGVAEFLRLGFSFRSLAGSVSMR